MALSISIRKRLCANHLCASFYRAALRYASIASWVLDFICALLLRMLWASASYLLYFIMRWATSHGDRRGVAGCSTLGGGSTLGGVAFGVIVGFGGSFGVGTRPGSGNTAPTFCGSATGTLLVCFFSAIGGFCGWFS